jgi:hypothetical protein
MTLISFATFLRTIWHYNVAQNSVKPKRQNIGFVSWIDSYILHPKDMTQTPEDQRQIVLKALEEELNEASNTPEEARTKVTGMQPMLKDGKMFFHHNCVMMITIK